MDALAGRGYELAWLKDPVEAFFLQIQGSGKIVLPDGSVMSLSYAGNNGRPYRSVGRLLVETGKIPAEDLSADAIRMYLKDNPQEVSRVLDYNERYIFFEEGPAGGPTGSLGVVLTPERSVATDAACYPKGAMAYLETEVPEPGEDGHANDLEEDLPVRVQPGYGRGHRRAEAGRPLFSGQARPPVIGPVS